MVTYQVINNFPFSIQHFCSISWRYNREEVGHRIAIIIGGILGSIGFLISYFATSLEYLYGSMGLVAGKSVSGQRC